MADLPTGTVTFLFTDIEGSTALWEQHRDAARAALVRHDALVEQIVTEHHGQVVRPRGEGDSRFAAFARATDAVAAAAALQRALHAEPWPTPTPLRVRMAVHTGEADLREGDYYGSAVNRCARLRAVAHGGQTLVSLATEQVVRGQLISGLMLHDLGEHHLKDLQHTERVFQLNIDGVSASYPLLKTLTARPNNLPIQLTSFIGRVQEVAAVCQRLRDPQVRLLTLTAAGGSGKTRLALQVAAELLDDFPDGAWFVDLAPIRDPALVAAALAEVLGVTEAGGQPLVERLHRFLRDKHLLLVLDNFEQVLAAGPLVDTLLRAAPRLTLLVTSRVVLHVYGEHTVEVPPLGLPDLTNLPALEHLIEYAAIRLFNERAQAATANFRLSNETASAVAEICHRLDGLPLAIELAAARIRILPPQLLLQRLSSRLKVLTGGARTLPARQQTLRDAIDWSHDLLDPAEQVLFRRLAVFVGGWTLEAAEAVCDADGMLGLEVLDGLQSLLDKSLIRQMEHLTDGLRFTMLETIREYAMERLVASEEATVLRQAHAQFFLALVEAAERGRSTPDRPVWLQCLLLDLDNLRAALTWSRDQANGATLLQLAGALQWFWDATDSFSEGLVWIEAALRKDNAQDAAAHQEIGWRHARAKALYCAGSLTQALGRPEAARTHYAESVQLFRAIGNREGLARVLNGQGITALWLGDAVAARAFQAESVALLRELGLKPDLAWSLLHLANALRRLGDYSAARSLYEESRVLYQTLGDRRGVAQCTGHLAEVSADQGDLETAGKLLEEGLAVVRELASDYWVAWFLMSLGKVAWQWGDDRRATQHYAASIPLWRALGTLDGVAEALRGLGDVALRQQDFQQARMHYIEALEVCSEQGYRHGRAWSIRSLAHLALRQGNSGQARTGLRQALQLFRDLTEYRGIAACQEDMALVAAAQEQPVRAVRLLAGADAQRGRMSGQRELSDHAAYERTLATVRDRLDEMTFAAAWAEGRAMTLKQAIAYALEEPSASG